MAKMKSAATNGAKHKKPVENACFSLMRKRRKKITVTVIRLLSRGYDTRPLLIGSKQGHISARAMLFRSCFFSTLIIILFCVCLYVG